MKLILLIVNTDDVKHLTRNLLQAGHQVTKISSTGGFLQAGNAALLSGVQDEQVDAVLTIVQQSCHTRSSYLHTPPVMAANEYWFTHPIEVQAGGAVAFVLNIERFERF